MNIKINLAVRKDFEELSKIYAEEFSKQPYNEPWTNEKAKKKMDIFSMYCDIWKILFEKEIVGLIVINPNQWCPGEVIFGEEMAIKSEMQNKGIGFKALQLIFGEYRKRGFKKFMGLENKNSRARNLYNRIGTLPSKEYIIIEKELNNGWNQKNPAR